MKLGFYSVYVCVCVCVCVYGMKENSSTSPPQCDFLLQKKNNTARHVPKYFSFQDTYHCQMVQGIKLSGCGMSYLTTAWHLVHCVLQLCCAKTTTSFSQLEVHFQATPVEQFSEGENVTALNLLAP